MRQTLDPRRNNSCWTQFISVLRQMLVTQRISSNIRPINFNIIIKALSYQRSSHSYNNSERVDMLFEHFSVNFIDHQNNNYSSFIGIFIRLWLFNSTPKNRNYCLFENIKWATMNFGISTTFRLTTTREFGASRHNGVRLSLLFFIIVGNNCTDDIFWYIKRKFCLK